VNSKSTGGRDAAMKGAQRIEGGKVAQLSKNSTRESAKKAA
jgi:hypothetical protein